MSTLLELTGKAHLSYSSMDTYISCGTKFWLQKVLNAPQVGAYWFAGGGAVHTATEWLDLGLHEDPTAAFINAWDNYMEDAIADGQDPSAWSVGGRVSKENPNKEDAAFWLREGPKMVERWVTWRDSVFDQGWQWYVLPDGSPSIEVPVQVEFPTVYTKGAIDRVLVNDSGELVVLDLKTGSRIPDSVLQLAGYALGMQHNFGVLPILGSFFMARAGVMTEPRSLLHMNDTFLANIYEGTKRGIEAEMFVPHPSSFCRSCGVNKYCVAYGGNPESLLQIGQRT